MTCSKHSHILNQFIIMTFISMSFAVGGLRWLHLLQRQSWNKKRKRFFGHLLKFNSYYTRSLREFKKKFSALHFQFWGRLGDLHGTKLPSCDRQSHWHHSCSSSVNCTHFLFVFDKNHSRETSTLLLCFRWTNIKIICCLNQDSWLKIILLNGRAIENLSDPVVSCFLVTWGLV